MKNRFAILISFVLAAMIFSVGAAAQQSVKGTAKDEAGKPIANATVEMVGAAGHKLTATTNPQGEFFFAAVPEGRYDATLLVNGKPVEGFSGYPVSVRRPALANRRPSLHALVRIATGWRIPCIRASGVRDSISPA